MIFSWLNFLIKFISLINDAYGVGGEILNLKKWGYLGFVLFEKETFVKGFNGQVSVVALSLD